LFEPIKRGFKRVFGSLLYRRPVFSNACPLGFIVRTLGILAANLIQLGGVKPGVALDRPERIGRLDRPMLARIAG
jgi:hypothetical protein